MKSPKKIDLHNAYYVELPRIQDGIDGTLSVAECARQIPFPIQRVYYIYDLMNRGAIRGKHAHKQLEQVFICARGSCQVELDDGRKKQSVHLAESHIGIYLGTKLWVTFHEFSSDCFLIVLASDIYREEDYIRDYQEFLSYVNRPDGSE